MSDSPLQDYQTNRTVFHQKDSRRKQIIKSISVLREHLADVEALKQPAFNCDPERSEIHAHLSMWPTKEEINDLLSLPNLRVSPLRKRVL